MPVELKKLPPLPVSSQPVDTGSVSVAIAKIASRQMKRGQVTEVSKERTASSLTELAMLAKGDPTDNDADYVQGFRPIIAKSTPRPNPIRESRQPTVRNPASNGRPSGASLAAQAMRKR